MIQKRDHPKSSHYLFPKSLSTLNLRVISRSLKNGLVYVYVDTIKGCGMYPKSTNKYRNVHISLPYQNCLMNMALSEIVICLKNQDIFWDQI